MGIFNLFGKSKEAVENRQEIRTNAQDFYNNQRANIVQRASQFQLNDDITTRKPNFMEPTEEGRNKVFGDMQNPFGMSQQNADKIWGTDEEAQRKIWGAKSEAKRFSRYSPKRRG
jgi:hypothetical protein